MSNPQSVTNLVATVNGINSVMLTWQNNNPGAEAGAVIERSVGLRPTDNPQGQFQILATVAANVSTFADMTTTSGTAYQYRVSPLPCQTALAQTSAPFVNPVGVIVDATTPGVMRYLDASAPSPYGTGNQFSYQMPLRTN